MTEAEPQPTTLAGLLAGHPPFAGLEPAVRGQLCQDAVISAHPAGTAILVEDGPPAGAMWVVVDGSVALIHDGQVIQVLGAGDCFGHPSLLTGMAPAYTVRTREPTRLARLRRAAALAALGTPAGAAYVAASMRSRLVRQGHITSAVSDVGTTPVSAIMSPAVFVGAGVSVRMALEQLCGAQALIVGDAGAPAAMITDATIRRALLAGTLQLDAPLGQLGDAGVVRIPVGQLAVEASVDMLAAGAECVAVVEAGRVVGVLSAGDLVGLDAQSPIALRHMILGAADLAGLIRSAERLPRLFALLHRAGVPPRDLGRVLSLQHDALVSRLLDLSISRHGPPLTAAGEAIAWAWLDLGSAARREYTLGSDQDNALAYADPPSGSEEQVDAYFAQLGSEVNEGLVRCGFGADHNGVMASRPLWRMPKSAWVRTFDECFRIPDESHLIRASVAFDFRSVAGGLAVTAELGERIRAARSHPDFMRLMARAASGFPVALNRRGRLATGGFDEPPGRLDLKRGAVIPLVNLIRYHALAAGVTISPTLDRIDAAASLGQLDQATATTLREAYGVIAALRFDHHAAQIEAGAELDNLIDPDALSPIRRRDLEEALGAVRRARRQIEVLGGSR